MHFFDDWGGGGGGGGARTLILKECFLSDDRTPSFKEDMIGVTHYSIAPALAIFTTFIKMEECSRRLAARGKGMGKSKPSLPRHQPSSSPALGTWATSHFSKWANSAMKRVRYRTTFASHSYVIWEATRWESQRSFMLVTERARAKWSSNKTISYSTSLFEIRKEN